MNSVKKDQNKEGRSVVSFYPFFGITSDELNFALISAICVTYTLTWLNIIALGPDLIISSPELFMQLK